MTRIDELQRLADQLQRGEFGMEEIRDLLHHPAALIRANALNALSVRARVEAEAVSLIVEAATAPDNRIQPLFATTTVAHIAVACLFRAGSRESIAAGIQLVSEWRDADRGDLVWYLESEGLLPST